MVKKIKLAFLVLTVLLPASSISQSNIDANPIIKNEEIELGNVKIISRVTGKSLPGEDFPSPNKTAENYDVGGTDLGIFWALDSTRVGIFFGDTNGKDFEPGKNGGNGRNWRSNVLAFSEDLNLDNGLSISGMLLDKEGQAREIVAGAKTIPGDYQTSIPTSAIRACGIDVVHYMNIYEWAGGNGRWLTNFSSLYFSKDEGQNWKRAKEVTFESDSHFSQVSYAKRDGVVYMIGVQAGRGGDAYLCRFREKNILDKSKYEYWNGEKNQWIRNDEKAATVIIPGPIGEASLLWHEKYKRWIIAYSYDFAYAKENPKEMHALVYRDSKNLTGPWSELKILTTAEEYPGLYSPYLHPLKVNNDRIYFTMSLWDPYNVFLMSATIDRQGG